MPCPEQHYLYILWSGYHLSQLETWKIKAGPSEVTLLVSGIAGINIMPSPELTEFRANAWKPKSVVHKPPEDPHPRPRTSTCRARNLQLYSLLLGLQLDTCHSSSCALCLTLLPSFLSVLHSRKLLQIYLPIWEFFLLLSLILILTHSLS